MGRRQCRADSASAERCCLPQKTNERRSALCANARTLRPADEIAGCAPNDVAQIAKDNVDRVVNVMSWLPRIRAAGILTLFWAIIWGMVGAALGIFRVLTLDSVLDTPAPFRFGFAAQLVCQAALLCAAVGAINGFVFTTLLGAFGRRLRGGLTSVVVGGFGALAGATLPLLYEVWFWSPALPGVLVVAAILGALGALTALGTLAIARAGGSMDIAVSRSLTDR